MKITWNLPRTGWVIPRLDGKPLPNSPARISQAVNAYLHSVGVPETLHQLRHRFGTMGYNLTLDIRLVQEQMGHARPETTAGYAAYSQAGALEMVEALPVPARLRSIAGLLFHVKRKRGPDLWELSFHAEPFFSRTGRRPAPGAASGRAPGASGIAARAARSTGGSPGRARSRSC